MATWFGFMDWPLRAKIVALLVTASLVPLGIAAWTSVKNARDDEYRTAEQLLTARADMLAQRIDGANHSYARIARLLALAAPQAVTQAVTQGSGQTALAAETRARVRSQLEFWKSIDPYIRAVSLLDASGSVLISSEEASEGTDLAGLGFVRDALNGAAVISDVLLVPLGSTELPTIGFLAPVRSQQGVVLGAVSLWVHPSYLWEMMREVNDQAGPGSFAVLVDSIGIRIGHSTSEAALYRPIQQLDAQTIDRLAEERRFGARTRELVSDVLAVDWTPPIDYRDLPGVGMFRVRTADGFSGQTVAMRCTTAPWVLAYITPEAVLTAELARIVRSKLLFAAVIMVLALAVGLLFASAILRPVRQLMAGGRAIGAGNLDSRIAIQRGDELGELGVTFNTMAARIQEQSAALLRESEDQYRKLFQTMNDGFCTIEMIFDDQGNPVDFVYLEVNREFELQSGLRDVPGRRKSEVVPDLEDHWMQTYARVALTGEPMQIEEESSALGRYFDVRAYRVGGPGSRRVAVLFSDITERKLAQRRQQAQLESLNLLHQVTRAIGERQDLPSIFQVVLRAVEERLPVDFGCICLFEAEHNRLLVERVGERSLPRAAQMSLQQAQYIEIDGNGLSRCVRGQLVYEPDVGAVPFPFPQRLAAGGLRSLVAAPLLVESKVFGVLIAARKETGFSSGECEFLKQLSEHVALAAHHAQLYAALQGAYEELRQTQQASLQQERLRALGQMASGIAHDINNAISPVALYTDSLLERETGISPRGRGQLQTIQRAIHDVAATVARMREFYRQREQQRVLAAVQLNELVPQVAELTRPRWNTMPQQRGVTIVLRTDLAADLPPIMGAQGEIREALTNLIINAVDAMPEGGTLTLRTRVEEAGLVQVEVCDTGIGMDEDARRRCLEPFFTTKGERGTGLGLPMVYGMVQRHSADIEVESAPGKGTCVRLTFSASGTEPVEDDASPQAVPRGLRILVVDDDPVLLRTLRDTLESDGHHVVAASGGQEGIDSFRAAFAAGEGFDVALTDLGMPHVDGRQVARVLKGIAPTTPVIMLTGWGQRLVAEEDIPQHVDVVLSKPPKLRDLRDALARCCRPS